jgi:hypothetical protein
MQRATPPRSRSPHSADLGAFSSYQDLVWHLIEQAHLMQPSVRCVKHACLPHTSHETVTIDPCNGCKQHRTAVTAQPAPHRPGSPRINGLQE